MNNNLVAVGETYGNTLVELGKINKDIFVVEADLMRCSGSKIFEDTFPDRHIQVGVAEQNLISISGGLAATGRIPFCSSFANFISQRACDQVLMSMAYNKFNVKAVGTFAGLTSGLNGGTHIGVADVAITRAMPNMKVMDPGDCREIRQLLFKVFEDDGPTYIRLARGPMRSIFGEEHNFEIGKGYQLHKGSDVTLITSGITTAIALDALEDLKKENISVSIIHLPTIKPIDEDLIIKNAKLTGAILTIENHSVIGGLGSAVSELLSENYPVLIYKIGLNDAFGITASLDYQLNYFGITKENIVKKCKEIKKIRSKA